MNASTSRAGDRCPFRLNRRGFLAAAGASALAVKMGVLDFAASLLAAAPEPAAKVRVLAAFVRPNQDRYWMGWPGAAYDVKARQAEYSEVLEAAAARLGVALDLAQEPLHDGATASAFLERAAQAAPDGLLLTVMHLNSWGHVNHVLQNRGAVPTVVFSPMGTSFTGHLQPSRKVPASFVAATQDVAWLGTGLRMLWTVWQMRRARLCICRGGKAEDSVLEPLGTTLHYVPHSRFFDELAKVEQGDEARAIADYYAREAKKIVEPTREEILTAAKNYLAARRLMEAEKCQGYAMDCLGPVGGRKMRPPCLAMSRLNDEGSVGGCEADTGAALSLRLVSWLCERPGFMQDPAPNTVKNTLMGAHCSCPTKLDGFDKPHEPFILRSHSESDLGVSMQVLWREKQPVTVMKFEGAKRMLLGTGRALGNIETPPAGGCRTSVEIAVDGVADTRDVKGFHQLFIYGDLEEPLKAYAQLAGIEVVHI